MNEYSFINRFSDVIFTPYGFLGIMLIIPFFMLMLYSGKFRFLVLAMAICLGTFGMQNEWIRTPLPLGLEHFRTDGRYISLIMMALLSISLMIKTSRVGRVSSVLIIYFIFELMMTIRDGFSQPIDRSAIGAFVFFLVFLIYGVLLGRSESNQGGSKFIIYSLVWGGIGFAFFSLLSYLISPSSAVHGGRFIGVTPNAQASAVILALASIASLYAIHTSENKKISLLYVATAFLLFGLLLWTGSRTGMLTLIVGVLFYYRTRLGRLMWGIALLAVGVLLWSYIFPESVDAISRLASTENTRAVTWANDIKNFSENMMLGNGSRLYAESSYIACASNYGLYGLSVFALFICLCLYTIFQQINLGRKNSAFENEINISVALLGSLLVAGAFEAILIVYYSYYMFVVYGALAVAQQVKLQTKQLAQVKEYYSPVERPCVV